MDRGRLVVANRLELEGLCIDVKQLRIETGGERRMDHGETRRVDIEGRRDRHKARLGKVRPSSATVSQPIKFLAEAIIDRDEASIDEVRKVLLAQLFDLQKILDAEEAAIAKGTMVVLSGRATEAVEGIGNGEEV